MLRTCTWACLLSALAGPAAWAQEDFLAPDALQAAGLAKYWQLQIPLEKGQQVRSIFLVDDRLYVGTQDGYVFAINAPTGTLLWLRPISRSGYPLRRPCHAGDRVIFATPTDLQIYDRRTGDPISRHDLGFAAGTPAITDGTLIFIGGLDRRLYTLDVERQYVQWRLITSAAISSTPVIRDTDIYLANDAGLVYACTRAKKAFRWETGLYDSVAADLVNGDEGVYVACRDHSLYLLDFEYGTIRWRARFSGPLDEAPVITKELAYQYSPADGLGAVEAAGVGVVDERIRWTLPSGRVALTIHADHVYVLTKDQTLVAANVKDGDVTSTVPAPGFLLAAPAPDTSTVFLASPDGRLFCARPLGVPPLQASDVLSALLPPGTVKGPAATQPTTRPSTTSGPADPLASQRRGAPVGGKSKVSRQFPPGTESE